MVFIPQFIAQTRGLDSDPVQLDRRADVELSHGRYDIAEKLSHRAAEIREAGQ